MELKFKVGDRVKYRASEEVGIIEGQSRSNPSMVWATGFGKGFSLIRDALLDKCDEEGEGPLYALLAYDTKVMTHCVRVLVRELLARDDFTEEERLKLENLICQRP